MCCLADGIDELSRLTLGVRFCRRRYHWANLRPIRQGDDIFHGTIFTAYLTSNLRLLATESGRTSD